MPNVLTTGTTNGPITTGEVYGTFAEVVNLNAGSNTSGSVPVLTPTFAASTAAQLSDTSRDYQVYLNVTTGGTVTTIAIGPTSAASAVTILASATVTAGQAFSFRLPAGWYVKWAGTSTVFGQAAVGC